MKIYYAPHKSRRKEAAFVEALIEKFEIADIVKKTYSLANTLSGELHLQPILSRLSLDLSKGKKWAALHAELSKLPTNIKVFLSTTRISCDVVIIRDDVPYYVEFHEKQHRTLSVDRPKAVYDMEGKTLIVPRYVQRYLRDMWRIENLQPFIIMWDTHFEKNGLQHFKLCDAPFQEYLE